MLKKMQWRFVGAAMMSISAVMLIWVLVINIWNYAVTIRNIEDSMNWFPQNARPEVEFIPMPGEQPGANPFWGEFMPSSERPYMMRFFFVQLDENRRIINAGTDFVSTVSEEQAKEYAAIVLENGKNSGFCGEYRYIVREEGNGSHILFLNVASELQFMRNLFIISLLVAFISLFLSFILIVIFSKRAIKPYADNIERQKRFITDAGHEIKTPLTSIVTSADLLDMEYGENEWVNNIRKQASRMSKLVKNMITLSRLDEETPFPESTELSFSDLLWEGIEPFIGLAKVKEKEFTYKIEENLILMGDAAALRQMISILLDNAIQYSLPNSEIKLKAYKKHRSIVLEISNACDSVKADELELLFERFYRPDGSRTTETGGNGIGLSIAKSVAEAHGGSIKAKQKNGIILFQVIL